METTATIQEKTRAEQIELWLDARGHNGASRETYRDALAQALAQYDSIAEMVKKLNAARESYPCFWQHSDGLFYAADVSPADFEDEEDKPEGFTREALDEEHGDEWLEIESGEDEPDEDDAREAIEEDALSVEVRSGWQSPGEKPSFDEFRICLCTGGPAVQITGGLNRYGEPDSAALEFQGWFIPWTETPWSLLPDDAESILLDYARVFYFGEG